MAILFPRLAQSHIKNGYYPTDEGTLERLASYFHPLTHATSIFDPCAGEGSALAGLKQNLQATSSETVTAYGIEYDRERAYQAKSLLDECVHSDLQDCVLKNNQFGILFLNPPYGDEAPVG